MEVPYAQQSQPPPSQPAYTMAPGPPSSLSTNDANYRREPPPAGPPYHAPPPSQHQQNGQQYAYNPTSLPSLSSRTPLPDQLLVSENGGASSTTLPVPGSMEKIAEGAQPPPSHSMIELGRRYTLDVVQQPKRARMCGFGDKDRRPITPPPCIRLIITDATTGAEIDTNDIDYGLFVINVDLWSADGLREVNLVRHSASSPAISSTIPTSYGQTQVMTTPVYNTPLPTPVGHPNVAREPQYPYHLNQPASHSASNNQNQAPYNPYPHQPQVNPYGQGSHQQNQAPPPPQSHFGQSQYQQQGPGFPGRPPSPGYNQSSRYQDPPNHHVYYHTGSSVHTITANSPRPGDPPGYNPADPAMNRMSVSAPIPNATGMYTRNLIGSLSASAFRLTDPNDKNGIWFVLQDLSVRTEGTFRLRFSFVNVGVPSKTPNGNASNQISVVNTGKAPILASCYSEVFTVYSAKKFPGVVESTPLSKCFATQGIKIPIRKDGPSKLTNRDEYDED